MICAVIMLLLIVALLVVTGCGAGTQVAYKLPEPADFSKLFWTEAFDSMHEKMSKEYAFTEWRGVDWEKMKAKYRPRVVEAEAAKDQGAYYMALREYLFSIPDGHVALMTGKSFADDGLGTYQKECGGGFGLTVAELDDGRIMADWVAEGGPAALAGVTAGAEVVEWGGKPAAAAMKETSTIWSILPQATDVGRDYQRTRFMVRAPVGTAKRVDFKNPGQSGTAASLTAVDDGMETLARTDLYGSAFSGVHPEKMIESRALEGGIGYIKIYGEGDIEGQEPTAKQFEDAVSALKARSAPGIVIDIRGNTGGADGMSAGFLGSFYADRTIYEYQNWYDPATGKTRIVLPDETTGEFTDGAALYIEPAGERFSGPVVALVDPGCISSGEGVAMGIRNLPEGKVVGFRGTNGSFGMVMGPMIGMPGGYSIMYPVGQSLDEDKKVQVDSRGRKGGVTPTDRVPMTLENALRSAAGRDVELEHAVKVLTEKAGGD